MSPADERWKNSMSSVLNATVVGTTRMSSDEIQERNRLLSHGTVNGSWLDWTCRRCRGEGEEGKEYRPKEPDVHDLTVDSDDDASSAPKPKPGPSVGSLSTTAPRPAPATGRNRRVPMKSAPITQKFRSPPPQVTPLPTKQTENRPASAKVPPTAAPKPTPAPTLSRRVPMKSATLASQKPYGPHAMAKLPSSKLPHDKEVVDLVSSDDEIQIVDPPDKSRNSIRPPETHESPTPKKEDQPTIDAQEPIPDTQEPPTLDIRDLSLEESVHDPPLPEFPSSEPTPFDHRLGPTVVAPRLAPVLPPALRPSTRSILGQRLVGATDRDRIVQMIGLEALKSGRWKLESRIRESVSLEPNPPRTGPDKGKGRAVGERTRDWTPLLQQEQTRERQAQQLRLQVPTAMFLVPPSPPTINPTLTQNVHPPRKPRKSMTVVHRDDTVKLEPVEFALS